jgi:hypothetical protein
MKINKEILTFLVASPRLEVCVRIFNMIGYIEERRPAGRHRG